MNAIRRADPALRRLVLLIVIGGAGVGAVALVAAEYSRDALLAWVAADTVPRTRAVLGVLGALLAAPLVACAFYVWRLGGRTVRAREYPPPGVRVVSDTPVVTGEQAAARGLLLRGLAIIFGGAAATLVFLLWRLESLFRR